MRVTQIALAINALLASIAAVGYLTGLFPHASEQPFLARGMGTRELAGALITSVVAMRLRRDSSLIALPMIFVGLNLIHHGYETALSGSTEHLPPLVVEAIFLSVYAAFVAVTRRRFAAASATK